MAKRFKPMTTALVRWKSIPIASIVKNTLAGITSPSGNAHSQRMRDQERIALRRGIAVNRSATRLLPYIFVAMIAGSAEPSRHIGETNLTRPAVTYARHIWPPMNTRQAPFNLGKIEEIV